MAIPNSRSTFKEYCLRKLGKGVLKINVTDDQVEDRIDEALKFYADYHFDGTEKQYYKHQVTQTDIDNGYITLPENIIGAVRVFELNGSMQSSSNLFDINYQFSVQALFSINSVALAPYFVTRQNLEFINQILNGQQPIRFNRHMNRLYVDMNWSSKITVGQYLMVEAYQVIDPDEYTDVWGDRFLAKYCTALIKRQWGQHLSKFSNAQMPAGIQFNGEKILDDAENEIRQIEEEMLTTYSLPVLDLMG